MHVDATNSQGTVLRQNGEVTEDRIADGVEKLGGSREADPLGAKD
ncbi:MAG: hypothetical protein ACYCUI_02880 [Vulcanimicrobiaceae bacterium]